MIQKIFLLLVIHVCFLKGQNNPIKITIYSHDSSSTTQGSSSTQILNKPGNAGSVSKNLLKWNYSLIARGMLMFNYERQLSKNFTFEMGLGLTYSDFFFSNYYEFGGFAKNSTFTTTYPTGITTTKSLLPNPFENSSKKTSFAVEVSPRYYFGKDEFEGVYISPYLSYRKYNYSLTVDEINGSTYATNSKTFGDLNYSFVDIGGKIGYQCYFNHNDAFYYDVYIGFAHRKANVITLQQMDSTDSNTGISTTTYSEYLQTLSLLQVMLGAKIGFAF